MHQLNIKIYYEDTDAGGIVYYANYLKYMERARTEMLNSLHIDQLDLMQKNIFFVVKKCEINYISSAILGDELIIQTSIKKISFSSILLFQKIFKNHITLTTGEILIVMVEKKNQNALDSNLFKIVKIPNYIVDKLKITTHPNT